MLQQGTQGCFAIVQTHEIHVIEQARLPQAPQFGVGIAPAQHHPNAWIVLFQMPSAQQRPIEIPRKRHSQTNHRRLVLRHFLVQKVQERLPNQRIGRGQSIIQLIEVGGGPAQPFGIPAETKMRINGLGQ